MMYELYGFCIKNTNISTELLNEFLCYISESRKKDILGYNFFEDSLRSLFGELLARCLIQQKTGIPFNNIIIDKNTFGKPIMRNIKGIHFNISHSEDWVLCAIDSKPIGVDVEKVIPIDISIGEKIFTKDEQVFINSIPEKETERFYKIWTIKESYFKSIGIGLSPGLNTFPLKFSEDHELILTYNIKNQNYFFEQWKLDCNYIVSICTFLKNKENNIKILTLEDILYLMSLYH